VTQQQLLQKLPEVRAWIENTLAAHSTNARTVLSFEFPRLGKYYSAETLASTFVVVVPVVPVPPLATLGLHGFEDFEQIDADGITYLNTYFVKSSQARSEALHFHELVHVLQWQHLGPERFLLAYASGHLKNGYRKNPLETMAFSLQTEFERRTTSFDVAGYVRGRLDSVVAQLLEDKQ
jgi:hypothetical protein